MFRIALALVYLHLFLTLDVEGKPLILAGILLLSALTDCLDGKIARRFHMVSELGKILDPIADKLTQGILLICLLYRYQTAKYVLLIFLLKEGYMFVKGLKTISVTGKNEGAMWYGKINTTVFYVVMVLLALCPGIPDLTAEYLLLVCGVSMLLAWFMYARYYCEEIKNNNKKKQIYEKRETVQ
jgi:cardiolipin synthase